MCLPPRQFILVVCLKCVNSFIFQLKKPLSTLSIPAGSNQQHQHLGGRAASIVSNSSYTGQQQPPLSSSVTEHSPTATSASAGNMPKKLSNEGDASIALVGVRSEFPKFSDEKSGSKDRGPNVGYR